MSGAGKYEVNWLSTHLQLSGGICLRKHNDTNDRDNIVGSKQLKMYFSYFIQRVSELKQTRMNSNTDKHW